MTSGFPVTPTFEFFSGSIGESGGLGLGLDCVLRDYCLVVGRDLVVMISRHKSI